jgi:predicted alpha/beta superfamily hydrolase
MEPNKPVKPEKAIWREGRRQRRGETNGFVPDPPMANATDGNNPGGDTLIDSALQTLHDSGAKNAPIEDDNGRKTRLHLRTGVTSRFLSTKRDVLVYLPPGYESGGYETGGSRRYPVLYLQDGQNLFDGKTSYVKGSSWTVGETADRLIGQGEIEPLIIVGVYNTGAHRLEEYTPTRDPVYGGGKADRYGQLLTEELKPWVDDTYRTLDGPEHTGIGGSSLGGLVSLYLGLRRPDVFGRLAVLSPSVWWHRRSILSIVKSANPDPRPRIWLDMGSDEGAAGLRNSDQLQQALLERGWREGEDLQYTQVQGGRHDERAWALRVGPFLKFLFPADIRSESAR